MNKIINEITLNLNADLKDYCTIHIGGKAKFLFNAYSKQQLYKVCIWCEIHRIKYKVIGLGANLIFDDAGYNGAIIVNKTSKIFVKGNNIFVESGMPVAKLIYTALEHNLSGVEHLSGIPATVGGAITNNLGAFDVSFADLVDYVLCLDTKKFKNRLNFSQQNSNYKFITAKDRNFDICGKKNVDDYPTQIKKLTNQNDDFKSENFGDFSCNENKNVDEILDEINKIDTTNFTTTKLKKESCNFAYRDSIFKNCAGRYIILGCKLNLKKADQNFIQQQISATIQKKIENQPLDYPSVGSVFKRIYLDDSNLNFDDKNKTYQDKKFKNICGFEENSLKKCKKIDKNDKNLTNFAKNSETIAILPNVLYPAKIIDDLGLKGVAVGGAQISKKHAGFIINTGDATQKDFIELTNLIKNKIYSRHHLTPQFEVEFVPY